MLRYGFNLVTGGSYSCRGAKREHVAIVADGDEKGFLKQGPSSALPCLFGTKPASLATRESGHLPCKIATLSSYLPSIASGVPMLSVA